MYCAACFPVVFDCPYTRFQSVFFLAKVEKCTLNYNFMIMLKSIQNVVCMYCIYSIKENPNLMKRSL